MHAYFKAKLHENEEKGEKVKPVLQNHEDQVSKFM